MYGWLSGLLSDATGAVLDVGAGSGRDAAWFAAQGYDVVAVEPSSAMRSEGQHRHPDPRVRWLDDEVSELSQTGHLGISFDVVSCKRGVATRCSHAPRARVPEADRVKARHPPRHWQRYDVIERIPRDR
jgi:ubiquinone/menaquinone biosynthesis C-methylase UbiE